MIKKTFILLILIMILGFFLRFYQVASDPPSLNWDEAAIGYNAYSIMQTGHDEWGQFLPLHFKSYGEYKLPAQIYASIPGIAIFGLNELGVRITPVVYGTLTIWLLYLLAGELFIGELGKKKAEITGLLSAFLLAISPWHIQLTRASFESSFSVFWVVLGMWLLVKGFKNSKWAALSMIPFAISVYTYNTTRVFTPLFLAAILIIYWKTLFKFRKALILSVIIFGVLMLPLLPFLFNHADSRYRLVSITDDPGLVPRLDQERNTSHLPAPLIKFVYNRPVYITETFIEHYLAHFTPNFLFISGAPHHQHNVQNMGELYWFQAPFLLLGLYFLFKRKFQFRWFLLTWLLLSFVPVSVTNDSIPHALRTLIAAPFYQIMTGLGIVEAYLILRQKGKVLNGVFWGAIILVGALNFIFYLNQFYNIYPVKYSRDWQYGYKQAIQYISQHQNKYDEIVFSRTYGEPYMFTLFFLNYDPYSYQHDPNLDRFQADNWEWVLRFGKFYFPDFVDPGTHYQDIIQKEKGKKLLLIGKPGDFPSNVPVLDRINFLNGQEAFDIVEYP
jgi:4-amino-4-deoxy-L-arabinose transferase-like glycosyltransferase